MASSGANPRKRAKTPSKSPDRPGNHGGLLLSGNPGNKGGGRPKKAFKDFLAELRADPDAQAALEKAAKDSDSRSFRAAWQIAADYDDEKPAEKKQIVGPVEVRVKIVREGRRVTAS